MFIGGNLINVVGCLWVGRGRRTSPSDVYLAIVTNLVLMILAAMLFGPLLIAPGVGIVIAMTFAADIQLRIRNVLGATIVALLAPYIFGFGPSGLFAIDGDLRIHSDFFHVQLPQAGIALVTYSIALVLLSGLAARKLAINERTAIKSVELQAWHLRQLVRQA
jgi:hypothetical protein